MTTPQSIENAKAKLRILAWESMAATCLANSSWTHVSPALEHTVSQLWDISPKNHSAGAVVTTRPNTMHCNADATPIAIRAWLGVLASFQPEEPT